MKITCEKGNQTRPGITLGPASRRDGEHGGDPDSLKICHRVGLTYVSCSPYRSRPKRDRSPTTALANEPRLFNPGIRKRTPYKT